MGTFSRRYPEVKDHGPTVKTGFQKLRGQKRIEMKY
jgi:hypothetical protein